MSNNCESINRVVLTACLQGGGAGQKWRHLCGGQCGGRGTGCLCLCLKLLQTEATSMAYSQSRPDRPPAYRMPENPDSFLRFLSARRTHYQWHLSTQNVSPCSDLHSPILRSPSIQGGPVWHVSLHPPNYGRAPRTSAHKPPSTIAIEKWPGMARKRASNES